MPENVKGLARIGGQTSGTSLVSANARAFESYGLDGSFTSPISRDAGERFGKALNHLLADTKSRVYIGPSAYVFWTREESVFDPLLMVKPDAESVKLLFESPVSGRERSGADANDFYALALSASGGRAVVRDWLHTTIPEAEENLKEWFTAQRMVSTRGEEPEPLGLYALAASAYRDANKEMTPQIPAALVRASIKGGRLPEDLIARAVRRNRSESDVTRPRAALMKLVMAYGGGEGARMVERMEGLDVGSRDAAYNCGRLLAELEALQRAAIPGVKATIVDRYYGAASSAPASVFGTLMRGHTAHIGKVRKERPGVGAAIQDRIGEIMVNIGPDFPTTLTMREQAVFALGYYHQRAKNRADAKAARERKGE
jgi:CRISPR-associated protein Csd1